MFQRERDKVEGGICSISVGKNGGCGVNRVGSQGRVAMRTNPCGGAVVTNEASSGRYSDGGNMRAGGERGGEGWWMSSRERTTGASVGVLSRRQISRIRT